MPRRSIEDILNDTNLPGFHEAATLGWTVMPTWERVAVLLAPVLGLLIGLWIGS